MRRGFTIFELLVVIAIIGILMAVTSVLLSVVRERGRDAERMAELKELQNALHLFATQTGRFPIATGSVPLSGTDAVSLLLEEEEVIPETPVDPLFPAYAYAYQSNTDGTGFAISFCLETDTISAYNKGCGNIVTQ